MQSLKLLSNSSSWSELNKKLVAEGAELQDADGNVMSAEAAQEFIKGLI